MFNEEAVQNAIRTVTVLIEVAGVFAIIIGGVWATVKFLNSLRVHSEKAYANYRSGLGRAILLGLELLVAADIIRTVAVAPSYENLGVLGLIIVIRTFLSFSLEVEINGHWPWQGSGWERREPKES